jgi:SWI/SNF-related matrix-associated actin-dependent regulator 1 of chromatin subfamily A
MSYEVAVMKKEVIELQAFKIGIVDEAHGLKGLTTQRQKYLIPILKKCKRVIMISGTPALARPIELFNIMSIIRPDLFDNHEDFGERYCKPGLNHYTHKIEYKGCENEEELAYLLRTTFMIRRMKKDVLRDLPEKIRNRISIEAEPSVLRQIKALQRQLEKEKGVSIGAVLDSFVNQTIKTNGDQMAGLSGSSFNELSRIYSLTAEAK